MGFFELHALSFLWILNVVILHALLINHNLTGQCRETIEFTEFSNQIFVPKVVRTCNFCVRDQDATTQPANTGKREDL